jgi:hypothetical protein
VVHSSYSPLELTSEGAHDPVALSDGVWVNQSCTARAYVDFYVDVSYQHSRSNLFIEAVHAAAEVLCPRALTRRVRR